MRVKDMLADQVAEYPTHLYVRGKMLATGYPGD